MRIFAFLSLLLLLNGCSRNYPELIHKNRQLFFMKCQTFSGLINYLIKEVEKFKTSEIPVYSIGGDTTLELYSTFNNKNVPEKIKSFMDSLEITDISIEYRTFASESIWYFTTKENCWNSPQGQLITIIFMPKGYHNNYPENESRVFEAKLNRYWGMIIQIPLGPLE